MPDFETHDVGYVAHLKDRIHELEQALERSQQAWKWVTDLEKENEALKEGACRFNCRTRKEIFTTGFRYGIVRAAKAVLGKAYSSAWDEEDQKIAELAYKEWCEQEH